jgi:hypothetical protein
MTDGYKEVPAALGCAVTAMRHECFLCHGQSDGQAVSFCGLWASARNPQP